ncbi:helix-turn-helix domain-containing protein [Rossellomorea marisflavi]|uniref:helix-turn-helix domain-containing protein n=1 Tax=Rossellomorea marisflavi TaxID=189381 RepID=UPI00279D26D4|nr:helix-turn-helix transcriptional regulator [Rossellomorea marisflavi]UTE72821.1 helix-turn-helix domain-containing protein [Rossellomorea marisflavi]
MDAKEFGRKLKEIRKEKKITLLDLKAKTGYSDSYLSQIENGYKDLPKPALLRKLAIGLDVSPIYLMNLAGYSDSYIDMEYDLVKSEGNNTKYLNEMRDINVTLPCTEEIKTEFGEPTIRELSDDELRRRVFDLHDLLNMEVDLYYKNASLTDEKRKKVRTILELIFE